MATIIITSISVYVLSAFFMWLHTHIGHNKGGLFEFCNTSSKDFWGMVVPLLNTFLAIVGWTKYYPKIKSIKSKKKTIWEQFFNIKK